LLVGDGFGAVIDEEDEGKRQEAQADKAKQESDHECAGGAEETGLRQALLFCGRFFNAPDVRLFL
jgi:hypothetical protein